MSPTSESRSRQSLSFRKLHRILAPIMLGPVLLTLLTGTAYQFVELLGKDDGFGWLMQLHKGSPLHLEVIYPFLNAFGLLGLAITGILMWRQINRRQTRRIPYAIASVLHQLYTQKKLPPSIVIMPDGNDNRGSSPMGSAIF